MESGEVQQESESDSSDDDDDDKKKEVFDSDEEEAASGGLINTDWEIEVLDEENDTWHKGKAKKYNGNSNSIYVVVPSEGVEGDVALEWEFIRLVSCCDRKSEAVFEKLKAQQDNAASLASSMADMEQSADGGPLTKKQIESRIEASDVFETVKCTKIE